MSNGLLRFIVLLFLHGFVTCVGQWPCLSSSPPRAMDDYDKIRLGSIPPSCHNRCKTCEPCSAVQVPVPPGPRGLLPRLESSELRHSSQSTYSQFKDIYKPVVWKCQCGGKLFNP
ncbi:hypothetical protein HPP92_015748 [Vanilla planifolia]|uniref:Epidermal patterning factor-like protein n=1 Tax=Vanilla planifolia TaxID=51239 RepID=A0A835URE4_VANPL|nr:hypothetical protein HPP92_016359 [Vanilla planifolia]KAG0471202.1 hypothetical protein HPP92_015748 [Vanilla planifolia]